MELTRLNLMLFDEGAMGADAGQGDAQPTTGAPAGKPDPLEGVLVDADAGDATQEAQTDTHVTADTQEARQKAFEAMIKGEYKDLYAQRVQQAIDARFKATRTLEERQNALKPVLEALGSKYGVNPDDVSKLMSAIEQDDSYFEDEAERKGLTVEQLKTMKRMERENAALRETVQERQRRENADRIYQRWQAESDVCAQVYPNFSLQSECKSPETGERFLAMLRSGVDVKTAYEVIHKDDLLGGAIRSAVDLTQRRTVDTIRARGMRPAENGTSGSSAAKIVKLDPKKLTRAQREEISRRVQRGERVTFDES